MKTILICAASAILISGTASAREVISTPSAPFHGASAPAGHRSARLESPAREGVVLMHDEVCYDDPRRWGHYHLEVREL
jgi:hypothetical protein